MTNTRTKIQINDVTIHDDFDNSFTNNDKLISWNYQENIDDLSRIEIMLSKNVEDLFDLTTSQSIKVWSAGHTTSAKLLFDGSISSLKRDGTVTTISGIDKLWNLTRKNVRKIYKNDDGTRLKISDIASDLITLGGMTPEVTDTGDAQSRTIDKMVCDGEAILGRLQILADAMNYQIRYDKTDGKVHFEPYGNNDRNLSFEVGEEIIKIPDWKTDMSRLGNVLRVNGATSLIEITQPTSGYETIGNTGQYKTNEILLEKEPEAVQLIMDSSSPPTTTREGGISSDSGIFYYVDKERKKILPKPGTSFPNGHKVIVRYVSKVARPISIKSQESIDKYGEYNREVNLRDVTTVQDARIRARGILNKIKNPVITTSISIINDDDVKTGDKISVIDNVNKPLVNGEFVISSRKASYPQNLEELTIGNELLHSHQWESRVEDRIKRLEKEYSSASENVILEDLQFGMNVNVIQTTSGKTIDYGGEGRWSKEINDYNKWGNGVWGGMNQGTENYFFIYQNKGILNHDPYVKNKWIRGGIYKEYDYRLFNPSGDYYRYSDTQVTTPNSVDVAAGQFVMSNPIEISNKNVFAASINVDNVTTYRVLTNPSTPSIGKSSLFDDDVNTWYGWALHPPTNLYYDVRGKGVIDRNSVSGSRS